MNDDAPLPDSASQGVYQPCGQIGAVTPPPSCNPPHRAGARVTGSEGALRPQADAEDAFWTVEALRWLGVLLAQPTAYPYAR